MQSQLDTKQPDLEISKLAFKTFVPKKNYYYIYFTERSKPTQNKISQIKYSLLGINYASDIQRFCYYPKTQNIFTFLGFSTKNKMENAINEQSLHSAIIDNKIQIYEIENQREEDDDINSFEETDSSDTDTILENDQKFSLVLSIFIEEFQPEKNIYYCFFEEENKPKKIISSTRYRNEKYEEIKLNDIQRFYLLPNERNVYTFLGFLTEEELMNAITNPIIQNLAKNKDISVFYDNSVINIFNLTQYKQNKNNQDYNDQDYQTFIPKNKVYYLYFIERKNINQKTIKSQNNLIKKMINVYDAQRFCYYPETKDVFSFFGFHTVNDLKYSIDYLISNKYSINEINVYYKNIKKGTDEMKKLLLCHIICYVKNKIRINEDNDIYFEDFQPKENLIYVYFKDISNAICPLERTADDAQLFRFYPGTKDLFSFYGFSSSIKAERTINDNLSIFKDVDNKIYIYFNPHNSFNNLSFDSNKLHEFEAKENLIYIYFKENRNNEELYNISNCQDIQRFSYYPRSKDIYSFFGFNNKNDLISSIQTLNKSLNEIFEIKLYHPYTKSKETTTILIATHTSNEKMKFNTLNNLEQNVTQETPIPHVVNITRTFVPKNNLLYFYFKEDKEPTEKDINKHCKKLYGVNSASDIQRFCFYPEQKEVFTFLCFSNKNKLDQAMNQQSLLSSIVDSKIEIYSNEKEALEVTKDNEVQKKKETKNCLVISLFIEKFQPEKDIFYCFFEEKNKPKRIISSTRYRNEEYEKIQFNDIQRFYLLDKERIIYTFLRFLTEEELMNAIVNPKLLKLAKNEKIFIYLRDSTKYTQKKEYHEMPKINDSDSADVFFDFIPKNNVLYIYFIEKRGPNLWRLRARNRPIRQISNAYDVQRYSYYPKTNYLFSFFGFRSKKSLKRNLENINLLNETLNREIYFYGRNIKHITDFNKKDLYELLTTNNIKIMHFKSADLNSDEEIFNEFSPRENIIYVYFKEIEDTNSNSFERISPFLKNSSDIQRFCYYPGTKDIYSFFGFLTEKPIENLINNQSFFSRIANNQIYLYYKARNRHPHKEENINKFQEFKINKDLIYFYLEEEISKFTQITNNSIKRFVKCRDVQQYCYYPGTTNVYSFFGFSNKYDLINSIKKSTMKLNEIFEIKLFYPSKNENEITTLLISTQISNEKMKFNTENPKIDYESIKQKSQFSIKETQSKNTCENDESILKEQKIDPNVLPKCVIYENDDIQFKTFEPLNNLFYCFFAEKIVPNKMILGKVKKIYQINSASDIQRFCYYPKTNNIYTFIGFSNEFQLNTAKKKSSLKSAVIDQSIFNYPYDCSNEAKRKKKTNMPLTPKEEAHEFDQSNHNQINYYEIPLEYNKTNHNELLPNININSINVINGRKYDTEHDSKKDINESFFKPNDDLYYIYFKEKNYTLVNVNVNIHDHNAKLFGIDCIQDLQRGYRLDRKDSSLYTFFGFNYSINCVYAMRSLHKNSEIIESSVKRLNDNSTSSDDENDESQNSRININDSKVETKLNNNSVNNDKSNSKQINMIDNQNNDNKNNDNNSVKYNNINNQTSNEAYFDQDPDLFYIYCIEKNCPVFNHREKSCSLFNIHNIQDLQRGYRISDTDLKYYTFFGFSHAIDANIAMRTLCNEKQIEISSIHQLDDEETESSDEYNFVDNNEELEEEDYNDLSSYSSKKSPNEKIHF